MTFVNILPTVQIDTFCMAQYFISVVVFSVHILCLSGVGVAKRGMANKKVFNQLKLASFPNAINKL